MLFREKTQAFIICICNHKVPQDLPQGRRQLIVRFVHVELIRVIVRAPMGTLNSVLIPLLGELHHRFGHFVSPWGPPGMGVQGTSPALVLTRVICVLSLFPWLSTLAAKPLAAGQAVG